MAGQPEPADDLIAELAKLMAQDAGAKRPEPAQPALPIRIPGAEAANPAPAASPQNIDLSGPVPRFDIAGSSRPQAPASIAQSAVTTALPEPQPEPFRFDFPTPRPAGPSAAAPTPAQAAPLQPEPAAPPADADPAVTIADLIAAELAQATSADAPAADAPAPEEAPTPVAARPVASGAASTWQPAPRAETPAPQGQSAPAASPEPVLRPEQDKFSVPPVFGLGGAARTNPSTPAKPDPASAWAPVRSEPELPAQQAPAASEPSPASEPLHDIESLIGRAVSVGLGQKQAPAVEPSVAPEAEAPAPALRSLASGPSLPADEPALDPVAPPVAKAPTGTTYQLSGADEAILAAAEATGVEIGWVDPQETLEPASVPPVRRRPFKFRMSRATAGPLVAVTLLLASGFGLYTMLGMGRDNGPAPLLTADASPVKEVPATQPEAAAAPQSVVFNEIDGVVPGEEEQLVSRDQADVNEVTQVAIPAVSEEGLANRKVRTVTVRPDGTIVSGEDSVAGNAILPVDRPNVPEVPGAVADEPSLLANADGATPVEGDAPADAVPATSEPATPAIAPVQPGTTVAVVDVAGNPVAGKTATIPLAKPAGLVQVSEPRVTIETPATPAPVTPTASSNAATQPIAQATEVPALGNDAAAYVQLASQRTEADARATANALITRYGPLFGGANMEVQRVDLGEKGIFYRVRVPANSRQEASTICTNVKAAGGDCLVQ